MSISIRLLGEFAVFRDSLPVKLPSSKQARALLAYLLITAKPHRRDYLCDLFWEAPKDPRGSLRWSLSKIRPLVNNEDVERLKANRERVEFLTSGLNIDVISLSSKLNTAELSVLELESIARQLQKKYLDGIDLHNQPLFQQWLAEERQNIINLRTKVLSRLSAHPDTSLSTRVSWNREWLALAPLDYQAANQLLIQLKLLGCAEEASHLFQQCRQRFNEAGIAWEPIENNRLSSVYVEKSNQLDKKPNSQNIEYCKTTDGVQIAHASIGHGFPIVKAAGWLSHIEHDWAAPVWGSIFANLAAEHRFVRYDSRASGLSDWNVADISLTGFVRDLEAVITANHLEKFALLGISQGAATSIKYAVKYPERVSHLILFSAYSSGWLVDGDKQLSQRLEAIMALAECGWEQDNPAFRQFFSMNFIPQASTEELEWLNQYQRLCVSPPNAVRLISAFGELDVRDLLAKVKVPTLVIHSLHDECIEVKYGRDMAASIPNAEFVGLESRSHLLLGSEPAAQQFFEAIQDFIARN
tara:strand:- start:40919 stop:42499 length:1581 start_codon:yes stop_codon:yes gene_type:complete